MVKAVEGGGIYGDVVVEPAAGTVSAKKHIAGVRYEPISLSIGLEARPILAWIASNWKGDTKPRTGKLSSLDFDYKVRSETEFTNAFLTETTFPAFSGDSKDAGFLTVKLAPEVIRVVPGSGVAAANPGLTPTKAWLMSNFRFEMDGLDATRVNKVESFTVRQPVVEQLAGKEGNYAKTVGVLDFPVLKISISESTAKTWVAWHQEFVIKGNNADEKEKNGALVILNPSLKNELARVNLFSCGISRLAPEHQVANSQAQRRLTAELYCERMELVVQDPPK
jgi:hypothetical protein